MAVRRSMRFQASAIVVASLLLSHAAGLLFYTLERRGALEITEAIDRAERAADTSRLVREVRADRRQRAVRLLDTRAFRTWISAEPAVVMAKPTKAESDVTSYLQAQLPEVTDQNMRVRFVGEEEYRVIPPLFDVSSRAGAPASAASLPDDAPSVAISIRLDDEWINFLGPINRSRSVPKGLFLANVISAVVGIALVAFWLVNRVTAPLTRLARAAESLGRNLHSRPLPESGPREVAVAAAAFNRMQWRLVRLIRGRTEFLAAISHDLRTPLTQIRLRIEMMPPSPEREKNLRSLDDLAEIIGSFLAYARASQGTEEMSRIDLGALVGSVCDDLADNGAAIDCDCAPGLIVSCKRLAIKRAVTNLIENALKYGQEAQVSTSRAGGYAAVRVEDRGPGIPSSQIEAVLSPFHRGVKPGASEAGGVGLGLSIAQAIAEDHGGELHLTNRGEGGLRAELILPLHQSPERAVPGNHA